MKVTENSRNPLLQLEFFELAQSGGSEQNSVSIALKSLREGTFFNLWSGGDREKFNPINVSDPQSTRFTTPFLSGMLARSE
jgi:hypothetical protein